MINKVNTISNCGFRIADLCWNRFARPLRTNNPHGEKEISVSGGTGLITVLITKKLKYSILLVLVWNDKAFSTELINQQTCLPNLQKYYPNAAYTKIL